MSSLPFTGECFHKILKQTHLEIISLNFFIGRHRTVLLAGLALKTQGSLVKGLTPLRALVAGLFFSFMLRQPPSLKLPFFFNSLAAKSNNPVTTALAAFGLISAPVARALMMAVCVMAPLAFMARFIAGAMVSVRTNIEPT